MIARMKTLIDVPENRQDPRIARSRYAVQKAVLELLRSRRDFRSLTVSEVSKLAGVTRKTFYSRFGSLEQVVTELVSDSLSSISHQIDDAMLKFPLKDNSIAMLVIKAYQQHQDVLAPLIRYCPASLFMKPASQVSENLLVRATQVNGLPPMSEMLQQYLVAMVGSMTHALLTVWVERGFTDPPEQLAALVHKLFGKGLQQLLSDMPDESSAR
jgi:AcrR family transcriptional regulator